MAASYKQRHSTRTTQLQKTTLAKYHRKPAKYRTRVHPAVRFDPLTWMLFKYRAMGRKFSDLPPLDVYNAYFQNYVYKFLRN